MDTTNHYLIAYSCATTKTKVTGTITDYQINGPWQPDTGEQVIKQIKAYLLARGLTPTSDPSITFIVNHKNL